ncbi:lipopolysaccharide biosynthesis protein [Shewanella phaeophyticola]|uniref:Lipopolysaccharide biosynthesis protein n=1 Tax=Shewanella phaeophyticola TaxID=2978345 RepID=A0ABT2NZC0_9GAMM|nr:lipopolysaccharide biosynthesis protein [Shewanella sp. KJ10-1]MCT8985725.1 lipopolysaccharide biosynthesis protein [Shewanella sp. KJ10-1]
MSQKAVDKIEQRFQALADKTDTTIWNAPKKLINLSKEIEKSDIYLARRVMQRVRNLQPNNPNVVKELTRLSNEIAAKAKMTQTSSSKEYKTEHSHNQNVEEMENTSVLNNIKLTTNQYFTHFQCQKLKQPWVIVLLIPFVLFSFYQLVWAAPRYESRAQLIIQQPDGMSTMDPSMALLSGLGVGSNSTADTELAKAYIHSEDMLNFLQKEFNLQQHYHDGGDIFSRLSSNPSIEDLLKYYIEHTIIEIDEKSGVIKILVQGFTPEYAKTLTQAIVDRAEWYINSIGHQLADAQLEFIRGEHQKVETRLRDVQKNILAFQQKNNLLDPEAEGTALQQITYGLESQIASKSAELKGLTSVMTSKAPQVMIIESELAALKNQLELERERLSLQQGKQANSGSVNTSNQSSLPRSGTAVSEVLAQFADLKIELELALNGYTASEISLDKARIEAYRQLKYLVVVESATLPQDNQYPKTTYNILLFLVFQLMLFGIGKIIIATAKELR